MPFSAQALKACSPYNTYGPTVVIRTAVFFASPLRSLSLRLAISISSVLVSSFLNVIGELLRAYEVVSYLGSKLYIPQRPLPAL